MQQYIVYKCDYCDKTFGDPDSCKFHEAEHLGLSIFEYDEWEALKEEAKQKGWEVSNHANDDTRREYDKAIRRLVSFETAHNLIGKV